MRRAFGIVICCFIVACGSKAGAGVPLDASNTVDGVIADATPDVSANDVDAAVSNACCSLVDALAFLPPGATACGEVALNHDAEAAYACATAQFQKGAAFHATFQQHGTDSYMWTTLASSGDGRLFVLQSDSYGCPGMEQGWIAAKTHVGAQRCQDAAVAAGYGKTWLTCTALVAAGTGCGEPASTDNGVPGVPAVLRIDLYGASGVVPKVPVAWQEFRVQKSWGPCPPDTICKETWRLSPDGKVVHGLPTNKEVVTQLPAETLAPLAKLLADPQFLLKMQQGFACPAVTDVSIAFRFAAFSAESKQEVAGCVLGDAKSLPAEIAKALAGL